MTQRSQLADASSGSRSLTSLLELCKPTCHSSVVTEMRTFSVSLVASDEPHTVDVFYKYRGEQLPEEGEVIDVVRFLRGRVSRARVTRVDANSDPQIAATQID